MHTQQNELGIYIHWPFCKAKCPYCDFNSHVRQTPIDETSFVDSLIVELNWFADQVSHRKVSSIFFGGGTPSLMTPNSVARLIDAITADWSVADDVEISLEANPTSIEAENFTGYRSAGINRVSVGVQALNDDDLKSLGRQHSANEAIAAYQLAAKIFPRTSFDLIYARPKQSLNAWREELTTALSLQNGHMSLYQLTIEPGTRFAELAELGKLPTPGEDDAASLYELTQELTDKAGLVAYEVSNHARPGHEARHNCLYWNYGEYIGIGPGAHSRFTNHDGQRFSAEIEKHPELWRQHCQENGHGLHNLSQLDPTMQDEERLLMGLRLKTGIPFAGVKTVIDNQRLAAMREMGLVELTTEDYLRATTTGRPVLNGLISYLLAQT